MLIRSKKTSFLFDTKIPLRQLISGLEARLRGVERRGERGRFVALAVGRLLIVWDRDSQGPIR